MKDKGPLNLIRKDDHVIDDEDDGNEVDDDEGEDEDDGDEEDSHVVAQET